MNRPILVIGAGNSGLAMAAFLSSNGHIVNLWNRSLRAIIGLIQSKSVNVEGKISGSFPLNIVSSDISEAIKDVEIVLVTTPAYSHIDISKILLPHRSTIKFVFLNPGRTFGAIECEQILNDGNSTPIKVAESQTIVFTSRKINDTTSSVLQLKTGVGLASLSRKQSESCFDALPNCLKPYFTIKSSLIETSIGNVGMILHCAPLLLNSGWVESSTHQFKYYYDGISPSIGKLLEKMDFERCSVADKLGSDVESLSDWLTRIYSAKGESIFKKISSIEIYKQIEAPKSLDYRYLTEDIPCGLVPLELLGNSIGVNMEITTLIINLASVMLETDFRNLGRSSLDLISKFLNCVK